MTPAPRPAIGCKETCLVAAVSSAHRGPVYNDSSSLNDRALGVLTTAPAAGYQIAADASEKTLPLVGIELLERIDAPGGQASYRTDSSVQSTWIPMRSSCRPRDRRAGRS